MSEQPKRAGLKTTEQIALLSFLAGALVATPFFLAGGAPWWLGTAIGLFVMYKLNRSWTKLATEDKLANLGDE